jgi:steroid 5-alpha reductase family enzyme
MMSLLLSSFIIVALLMLLTWVIYLYTNNPGIIDVVWSISIMTVGLIALSSTPISIANCIIAGLLILWGLRLSLYLLLTRILPGHIDKRYTELSRGWKMKRSLGFLVNYQFQGMLAWIIACPFWWLRDVQQLSVWLVLGCCLVIIGIIGEVVADRQLQRFKRSNKGKVCNVGLWRYSRHPNYFFEWVVWVGFAVSCLSVGWGIIAFVSPLLLLCLMLFVTGPMTEAQSLKSRGDAFKRYQEHTSMFFPWSL